MSKVQWLGDPVSDCKADPLKVATCGAWAAAVNATTGQPFLTVLYRDFCLDTLCTTGSMPTPQDIPPNLPAPPPVNEPYPWGVYDPGTVVLQKELNKKLLAAGLCPIKEDGKVGGGTCGAAKKYGVPLPSCAGHESTPPAPCGVTPKPEPVPPAAAITTPTKSEVPWGTILLVGGALAVAGVALLGGFAAKGSAGPLAARANPGVDAWGRKYVTVSNMDPPDKYGRHPKYKHLVMFEIEPHYGSYILTAAKHPGDALISEDDARHMFGKDYDAGFGYLTDEYLEILKS